MTTKTKTQPRGVSFDEVMTASLRDSAVADAFANRRRTHEIARVVRGMREQAGLSQTQLAHLIGAKQPTIARLETSAAHTPQWKLLERIGLALGKQLRLVFDDMDGDSDPEATETARLAQTMPADETQLLYSLCLHGRAELGLAPDEYAALTMVLLRLLAFKPAGSEMVAGAMPAVSMPASRPGSAAEPAKKPQPEPVRAVHWHAGASGTAALTLASTPHDGPLGCVQLPLLG